MVRFLSVLLMAAAMCSWAGEVKMPRLSGHRGDQELGLQNTMSAFKAAWENNCMSLELDVRQTKDGKLICFHDENFVRLAGDKRKVANLTYEEIKKIDISRFKHPMFKNERPPLLEDVFAAMPENAHLIVEIKGRAVGKDFPCQLRDLMKKYKVKNSQITVVSFEEDQLRNLNKKVPGMQNMFIMGLRACRKMGMTKGLDITAVEDKIIAKLKDIGCTGLSFCGSDRRIKYDKRFVDKIRSCGFKISMFTVDDLWTLRKMAELGVDNVVTNRPVSLKFAWEKRFGKSKKALK